MDYVDIWSHYTPYPFNQIPRSYSFMVAHPALWKFNYYLQQPRWVHVPTQRMWAPFVSRQARARAATGATCHLQSVRALQSSTATRGRKSRGTLWPCVGLGALAGRCAASLAAALTRHGASCATGNATHVLHKPCS